MNLTATVTCPKCGTSLDVGVQVSLAGAGHAPDGTYRVGIDAHISDRVTLDQHIHEHDQAQPSALPVPETPEQNG